LAGRLAGGGGGEGVSCSSAAGEARRGAAARYDHHRRHRRPREKKMAPQKKTKNNRVMTDTWCGLAERAVFYLYFLFSKSCSEAETFAKMDAEAARRRGGELIVFVSEWRPCAL